nr:MAG TPA: Terminase large subunit [Caudoviricetes sp.]
MEIYIPTTDQEFSQRKIEEYAKFEKIINWGRKDPVHFAEEFFGIKLIDYQKWCFIESWDKPFALWLCSRGTGKTTLAAVYLQTKMLLIPNYNVFVSTNSLSQSIDCFKKIEDLALQRIPSFKTVTDIFLAEVEKSANSETGFLHNPAGHFFKLYNNSSLLTLSTNLNALRGKRGSVYYDETSWQTREAMAATEHFADVDASFGLGVEKVHYFEPIQMPLQLLYASSAGDVTFPFYEKYVSFAKKMFLGDRNYFVCDINANTVVNFSTVDGEKIKSHLTQAQIDKAVDEDPELADRELFNKFRKDGGQNAVVKMDVLIRNSDVRSPLLFNDTGKKKFIFCYDPARNFDGSVLSIFQVMDNKEFGYWLQLENVVSMVDINSKNKTPLPMPQQLEIIKELMIKYNGERAAEWENIEFYIDAGSGGGGISAVADQLMEGWTDKNGIKHRGIIDPEHKQYETARKKYTNAMPIVHLIDPQGYKKVIYDALQKMANLNLIKFTDYDNKDHIMLDKKNGEFEKYELSFDEKLALTNINLLKMETSYMCRYDTPNGGVQYELAKDKKNTMHDDRAYTLAMGAYALAKLRREDLLQKPKSIPTLNISSLSRRPTIAH